MDGATDENHSTAATATQTTDEPRPPVQSALVEEAARVAATLNDKLPTLSPETPASDNHKVTPAREREPQAREEEASSAAHASPPFEREESVAGSSAAVTPAQAETRGRIVRRAATVGASVGENLRPRVEKLREASTVVFDEATDDPGLRFVIVAALLFILFLFIFLFSYILG
jgi:hypothetical protein